MSSENRAKKETRVITARGHPEPPDGEYALIEAYCTDPKCNCRRVMLNVVGRHQGPRYLASVSFGFDRDAGMAGPFLDPLNPGSRYANALFPLVAQVLADPAYVARLESHYHPVKRAAADPLDPAYEAIRRIRLDAKRWEAFLDRTQAGAKKRATRGGRKKRRRK